jgi:hypothetical protein
MIVKLFNLALSFVQCLCFEFVGDNPNCPVHGDKK